MPELSSTQIDQQCEQSCEWVKLIESELWKVLDALDTAKLAMAMSVREESESDDVKRFAVAFDHARYDLQGLLLDALCPEIVGGEEGK